MSDSKRSIGTGALRSSSGSSIPSLRSTSSSDDHPPSPAEPFGFGEGPYGGASSRAMQDVTKLALGTASVGRRQPAKSKPAADIFGSDWASATLGRPWLRREQSETAPGKKWKVDDRGWMVGAKQNSSPKVLKIMEPVHLTRPGGGMRAVTANEVPRRLDFTKDAAVGVRPMGSSATYESLKLAKGRIIGGRKEDICLDFVAKPQYHDESPTRKFPVRKLSEKQVEAYKYYEDKARHNASREYKNGCAPKRLSSQEAQVADAGWEARKTRQLSKVERMCDELYEAYSTGQRMDCGAEEDNGAEGDDEGSGDVLLNMRPIEKEKTLSMEPVVFPYQSSAPDSPTKEQGRPSNTLPMTIHRKPIAPSLSKPVESQLAAPVYLLSSGDNVHVRSSSSPAINPIMVPPSNLLLVAQLRSSSSSPPKRNPRTFAPPLRIPKLGEEGGGVTLPCAFPTTPALNIEEDVDDINERWPVSPTGLSSRESLTASGTVKRRRPAKPGLKKWKTLETVPLPFATAKGEPVRPRCRGDRDNAVDEHSLEGPELLYSPAAHSSLNGQRATVTFEIHPRVRQALGEAQRLTLEVLRQRGWFFWAVKVGVLCWVGVVLWALLDAVREGLSRVMWPLVMLWDLGVWMVGA